jgi:arginine/ornithine N-succinyltransferase beta subunit
MAIYHFDILDAGPSIPCDGQEMSSLDEARRIALKYAGSVLAEQNPSFWQQGKWQMTVSDARRIPLFSISVSPRDIPATI